MSYLSSITLSYTGTQTIGEYADIRLDCIGST